MARTLVAFNRLASSSASISSAVGRPDVSSSPHSSCSAAPAPTPPSSSSTPPPPPPPTPSSSSFPLPETRVHHPLTPQSQPPHSLASPVSKAPLTPPTFDRTTPPLDDTVTPFTSRERTNGGRVNGRSTWDPTRDATLEKLTHHFPRGHLPRRQARVFPRSVQLCAVGRHQHGEDVVAIPRVILREGANQVQVW